MRLAISGYHRRRVRADGPDSGRGRLSVTLDKTMPPGKAKPDTSAVRCPRCLSLDVRYSKRRAWDGILEMLLHLEVFRCRNCRKRFHVYIADDEEE